MQAMVDPATRTGDRSTHADALPRSTVGGPSRNQPLRSHVATVGGYER